MRLAKRGAATQEMAHHSMRIRAQEPEASMGSNIRDRGRTVNRAGETGETALEVHRGAATGYL
jgi:hypothetical protein